MLTDRSTLPHNSLMPAFRVKQASLAVLVIFFLNYSFETFWVFTLGSFSVPIKFALMTGATAAYLSFFTRLIPKKNFPKRLLSLTLGISTPFYFYVLVSFIFTETLNLQHHIYLLTINLIIWFAFLIPCLLTEGVKPIRFRAVAVPYIFLGATIGLNVLLGRNSIINHNWAALATLTAIFMYVISANQTTETIPPHRIALMIAPVALYAAFANSMGVLIGSSLSLLSLALRWYKMQAWALFFAIWFCAGGLLWFETLFGMNLYQINDLAGVYLGEGDVSSGRFDIWQAILDRMSESPDFFVGLGLSALPSRIFGIESGLTSVPHNLIYDSLLRVGLIGLILKLLMISLLVFIPMRHIPERLKPITSATAASFFAFMFIYDIGGFTHLVGTVTYLMLLATLFNITLKNMS